MKRNLVKIGCTAFFIASIFGGSITGGSTARADGHEGNTVSPIRFSAKQLAGEGLEQTSLQRAKVRGNPRRIISQASEAPSVATFFTGDVIALVYESKPAKFQLENTLYDEFIQVQEGTLVLTTLSTGESEKFVAGETLVLPKGWSGTWEMVGGTFRELVVVETKTLTEDATAD